MFLLWHPSLTAINVSYTFPILETSATALCGTTGRVLVRKWQRFCDEAEHILVGSPFCCWTNISLNNSSTKFCQHNELMCRLEPYHEWCWPQKTDMTYGVAVLTTKMVCAFICTISMNFIRMSSHITLRWCSRACLWFLGPFAGELWSYGNNSNYWGVISTGWLGFTTCCRSEPRNDVVRCLSPRLGVQSRLAGNIQYDVSWTSNLDYCAICTRLQVVKSPV